MKAMASASSVVLSLRQRRFPTLLIPLSFTLLLLVPVGLPTAVADVDTFAGPQVLINAISQANAYAKNVGQPGKFAKTVSLNLATSVRLTRSLPALLGTASLVVVGNCTKGGRPQRCVIEGAGMYSMFKSPFNDMAASRLTLLNLVFRNTKGGIFSDAFSILNVTNVSFVNNTAVDRSTGVRLGGYPPRYYTNCLFSLNRGRVIVAGNAKYGLANTAVGYRFRSCTFSLNTGGSVVQLEGGGTSVFDSVKFVRNSAPTSGAALNLIATTAVIVNSAFTVNTATTGNGAALYALSDFYGSVHVSICNSTFQGNLAPKATAGRQIYVASPAGTNLPAAAGIGSLNVCGSTLPPGTGQVYYPTQKGWTVSIRTGSCPLGSCKS